MKLSMLETDWLFTKANAQLKTLKRSCLTDILNWTWAGDLCLGDPAMPASIELCHFLCKGAYPPQKSAVLLARCVWRAESWVEPNASLRVLPCWSLYPRCNTPALDAFTVGIYTDDKLLGYAVDELIYFLKSETFCRRWIKWTYYYSPVLYPDRTCHSTDCL